MLDYIRSALEYSPDTGIFRWRNPPNMARTVKIGSIAGRINQHGYVQIGVGGRRYQAHRLAWLYVHGRWPAGDIDHINRIRSDNRISNLRDVTKSQNSLNTSTPKNNTSGYVGVTYSRSCSRWQAQFRGKYLGVFKKKSEAHAAYTDARRQHEHGWPR